MTGEVQEVRSGNIALSMVGDHIRQTGAHHRRPEYRCLGDGPGREVAAPAPSRDAEPVWIGDAPLHHGQRARHKIARLTAADVILEEPLQLAPTAGASSRV